MDTAHPHLWRGLPAQEGLLSLFPPLFPNHNSQRFWKRSTALAHARMAACGLSSCPNLSCPSSVLTFPSCLHQKWGS